MEIHSKIPLKQYLSIKLGGPAKEMVDVHTPNEVQEAVKYAKSKNMPIFILGAGCNVIARDEGFDGLVIRIKIPGFQVISDDINSTVIKVNGGEDWDETVKKTVDMKLSGIESMSGIPGTVGAAPVQNLGAYGQEISDTLQSVDAYDIEEDKFVTLDSTSCLFSYRSSIFRDQCKGRYVITSLTLKLSKNQPSPPFYESLQKYLDDEQIKIYTVDVIRNAVLNIRSTKLPDPKTVPNCGSFFKNPIIDNWQINELKNTYPDMPTFEMPENKAKIPAGWLIEKAGLKGVLLHGIKVYEKNALVLINESASSYSDLSSARDEIVGKVRDTFRVQIEQEPLEI